LDWNEWNSPLASVRLCYLLGLGLALYGGSAMALGSVRLEMIPLVGSSILIYVLLVIVLGWHSGMKANPSRQANAYSWLMLLVIPFVSFRAGIPSMAALLFIPAIHGVLRLTQRSMYLTSLICGVLWIVLRNQGYPADLDSLVSSGLELPPLALVLWILRGLNAEVAVNRNRITALSYKDELTGLLNMRAFTRMLQSEHRKAEVSAAQYTLLMIDIDGLQRFNDRYGHEQGNRVLTAVTDAIKRSTRSVDLIARYGGDEFMVFLPGAGDDVAEVVTNRIAQNVYNITLSFDRSMQRVSVNTGRAIYPDSRSTIQDMMSYSGRAMNRDKEFRRSVSERRPDQSELKRQAGLQD